MRTRTIAIAATVALVFENGFMATHAKLPKAPAYVE